MPVDDVESSMESSGWWRSVTRVEEDLDDTEQCDFWRKIVSLTFNKIPERGWYIWVLWSLIPFSLVSFSQNPAGTN
jgi:hypothetical protein